MNILAAALTLIVSGERIRFDLLYSATPGKGKAQYLETTIRNNDTTQLQLCTFEMAGMESVDAGGVCLGWKCVQTDTIQIKLTSSDNRVIFRKLSVPFSALVDPGSGMTVLSELRPPIPKGLYVAEFSSRKRRKPQSAFPNKNTCMGLSGLFSEVRIDSLRIP